MENEKGIVKLTRKQLYDEIWALSVAGVARKYNLNYGKLIATCKVENISFPSSGYWTKKNMGKDVSNEIVEFSGLEDTEISLITKDAVVKRIRKAKAEVVEKVHTDVTEELDVAVEEDLSQKKTENIPKWPDGILDYLDATERNKVLEYACNLQISQSTRLHKMLVQYKKDIADYKSKLKEAQSRPYYNPRHNKPENEPAFFKEMSDECMSRAIAILDTVFKSIESLGGSINSDLSVRIRGDQKELVLVKMNGGNLMDKDPFKEYMKQSEPNKRDKGYAWHTAIGLQAVDGLKTSKYLIDTAIKNIEGDISIDEAQELLNTYYEENPKADIEDRTEEADKVAVRIAKILSEKAFSFTPNEYISIHKKLFTGIYGHAGKLRDYNITKKEWVLNGATILYGSASELRATLDYDFAEEKKFSYKNLSMEEIIHHLAFFVSRLWQIHVFGEGNTRTTAVFFIKYLRTLGFDATNDIFAENAWYFRNALVRANYNDLKNGVHETTEYLELFLRNLLLDEKNELHNRTMHISGRFAEVDIERVKVDIESTKVDIRNKLLSFSDTISEKTINHTVEIFSKCGKENCFGRTIVEEITGLKPSGASKLIKLLVDSEVIVPVTGHGKGKYRFQ